LARNFRLIAVLALLSACASVAPPAPSDRDGRPSDEEASVLAAMDRYVAAISGKDVRTMAAMQTPEGMTYRVRAAGGDAWEVVARPGSYWTDPSRVDGRTHRERYWSPTVLMRGGIAVVWAPYEYWIDGRTSHCGVDVFDFVKVDGVWRVSNSMWTVEPDACAELRPADTSIIRPAG